MSKQRLSAPNLDFSFHLLIHELRELIGQQIIVRQQLPAGAKRAGRGRQPQVGRLARVQARVILHEVPEPRVLVSRHEHLSPAGVERRVILPVRLGELVLHQAVVLLDRLQLLLRVPALAEGGSLRVPPQRIRVGAELLPQLAQFHDRLPKLQLPSEDSHLLRQLRHDEARPPSQGAFRAQDVGVEVVADVQYFLAGLRVQHGLQVIPVASLECLAHFQKLRGPVLSQGLDLEQSIRIFQRSILGNHPEQIQVGIRQISRLTRADHHKVEQLQPLVLLLRLVVDQRLVIQVVHRRGRVLPVRIREEEHLHPRVPEPAQHGEEPVVQHQILLRIPRHLVLDHAVPVTQVDALPHLPVYLLVRLLVQRGMLPEVLQFDQRREEVGVDVLEQRVHVDEGPFREGRDLVERPGVHVLPHGGRYRLEPVVRDADVLVAIDLEEVPPLRVDDEAADPEGVIVLEVQHFLGVAQRPDQLFLRPVERQPVEGGLLVLGEGVVHVEPDRADVVEAKLAVAEHVVRRDGTAGGEALEGGEREVHSVEDGGEAIRSRVAVHPSVHVVVVDDRLPVDAVGGRRFREGLLGVLVRVDVVRRRFVGKRREEPRGLAGERERTRRQRRRR
mmetsp:Transcript_21994/g.47170  ORF Transcript_21994/g.47170 Transcript_21994/m.47170 type:complete len:615 (-) Transcript_21994:277-2121(-)